MIVMFGANAPASRLSTKPVNLSCPDAVVDLIEDKHTVVVIGCVGARILITRTDP